VRYPREAQGKSLKDSNSMAMAMMRIGKMGVGVGQGFMAVPMAMFHVDRYRLVVRVLVMHVVNVLVLMFQRFVSVFVTVLLG
jgi:hypothetical protein